MFCLQATVFWTFFFFILSKITQNLFFLQYFMFLFKFNIILMPFAWALEPETLEFGMNVLCQVDSPRFLIHFLNTVFIEFWGLVIYVSFQTSAKRILKNVSIQRAGRELHHETSQIDFNSALVLWKTPLWSVDRERERQFKHQLKCNHVTIVLIENHEFILKNKKNSN